MNILEKIMDSISGVFYDEPTQFDGSLESVDQRRLITNKETILSFVIGGTVIMFTVNLHGKTGIFIRHVDKLFSRFYLLNRKLDNQNQRTYTFNYNKRRRMLTYSFNSGVDMGVVGCLIYAVTANLDNENATTVNNWLRENVINKMRGGYAASSFSAKPDVMKDVLRDTYITCYYENKAVAKFNFVYKGNIRSIPLNLHALALINGDTHGRSNSNQNIAIDASYISDLWEYWKSVPDTEIVDVSRELNAPAFMTRRLDVSPFPELILCRRTYSDVELANKTEKAGGAI